MQTVYDLYNYNPSCTPFSNLYSQCCNKYLLKVFKYLKTQKSLFGDLGVMYALNL